MAYHVASPIYVISGNWQGSDDAAEMRAGSSVAWLLEKDAKAEVLTVGPDGLGALERRLAVKESQMAVLGARLLESPKAGVESADAISLRHRGERSLLASIAGTVERGLTRSLSTAAWWITGQDDAATVELNKDFAAAPLSPDQSAEVAARDAARDAKNWAAADRIRDALAAAGIRLEDTPAGTRWRRNSS